MDRKSFEIPHGDKLVHFTFYFVAAVLGTFFLREQRRWGLTLKKAFIVILPLTITFGIIIEVLQSSMTVDREGDVFDAIANAMGSLGGIVALKYLFSKGGFLDWRNGDR